MIRKMARISTRRISEVAICVLFLALVRTLAEYHRLHYVRGAALRLGDVGPYITGGLIASIGVWLAVVTYFLGRHKLATGIVVAVIVVMLAYKVAVLTPLPAAK